MLYTLSIITGERMCDKHIITVQQTSFCLYTYFSKQKIGGSLYQFFVEVLASLENAVYRQRSYIVVACLPRCKGEEISSKTLTMILSECTATSYVDID